MTTQKLYGYYKNHLTPAPLGDCTYCERGAECSKYDRTTEKRKSESDASYLYRCDNWDLNRVGPERRHREKLVRKALAKIPHEEIIEGEFLVFRYAQGEIKLKQGF